MACYGTRQAKALWDYAKANYVDLPINHPSKITDFKELMNRLASDLNQATGKTDPKQAGYWVPEEVSKLISTPKTVKVARNKLLNTDYDRRSVLNAARTFTSGEERGPIARFVKTAYEVPYSLKVFGHAPATHMTHAWPYAFDPLAWKDFSKSWVNAWKSMAPSKARVVAESIMHDPNFDQKVGSGLAVDPRRIYDDIQKRAGFWGKLGQLTSNSFLGLKQLRSMQWDALWDITPDHLKTRRMEQLISNHVNHMTGASPEVKIPEVARVLDFAPSLDVARVKRVSDFAKSVKNAWNTSDPETRFMARQNMKQWARVAGTISGMLYMNHLVLKHLFGSKEDVNAKDPFKGDWLAGKGPNGRIWQFTGGQVPMIRAGIRIVAKPSQAGTALGDYLMGKINPALSIAKPIAERVFEGKPAKSFGEDLPYPLGNKPATLANWTEYATAELGPIATEAGIHEFAQRMSDQNNSPYLWNNQFLDSFVRAGAVTIPSLAGTHTYQPEPPKSKSRVRRSTNLGFSTRPEKIKTTP